MTDRWIKIAAVLHTHRWLRDQMRCECGRRFDLLTAYEAHLAREIDAMLEALA